MTHTFVFAALLAVPAIAQTSGGPFIGCPLYFGTDAITLGPSSTLLSANESYYKRAGYYDLTAAASPTVVTRPSFAMDTMFGSGRPGNFHIDAISSGYCTVFCAFETAPPQ